VKEKTMKTKMLTFLALASVATVLAVPLCAQTISVSADIPFQFVVRDQVMPAGQYTVTSGGSSPTLVLRNASSKANVFVMTYTVEGSEAKGGYQLVFHRYGNQYFLSQVFGTADAAGREIIESRTERELAKTASVRETETVILLAKR